MIPVLDLQPEITLLKKELQEASERVLEHGRFIMGPEVKSFENEVAQYLGVKHAIGVNSGTDALLIALRAAGIGEGDEVITSAFTFFATAESIEMTGARPVFTDVEPYDFNIDPDAVEKAVTSKTKAIVPVHLFGKPAAMARLMELGQKYGLLIVEDCAQSFGACYHAACADCSGECMPDWRQKLMGKQTGTLGVAGAFSFFPSKNLGGFGDGGMITTDDDDLAEEASMLRVHGARKKYHNEVLGYNSRLDTLQAALLSVKMKHIGRFNEQRREVAQRYHEHLADVEEIQLPARPDTGHVYHQYTIRVKRAGKSENPGKRRDSLASYLKEQGIQTMIYYPVPCHLLPIYEGQKMHLPNAELLKDQVLSLPMGPFLKKEDQERVIEAVCSFFRG